MRLVFAAIAVAGSLACDAPVEAPSRSLLVLSSAQTRQVIAYGIDPESGAPIRESALQFVETPGALAATADGSRVYVALLGLPSDRGRGSAIATLGRDETGALVELGRSPQQHSVGFLRLDPTEQFLLAVLYDPGEVAVHRLLDGVCCAPAGEPQRTEPTAHAAEFDRSGRFVFVPHTETNRIFQFEFDPETGRLTPNAPAAVDGPAGEQRSGTRHYAQHPALDVGYSANEAGGGLTHWQLEPDTGRLSRGETLTTVPLDFRGVGAAAQVAVTPDGRWAYVSNRDVTRRARGERMRDSIAAFALDARSGAPSSLGTVPTVRFPRSMCIGGSGRYLFVAGQHSDRLIGYRIRPDDGLLVRGPLIAVPGRPVALLCLDGIRTGAVRRSAAGGSRSP